MLLYGLEWIALAGFAASAAYTAYAIVCVVRFSHETQPAAASEDASTPPVTIAKPLCGDEPQLYDNLRSFCEQDYPPYQVVFGVRDESDPAAAVARRLIADLPGHDLQLVVDARESGTNRKVSNLLAMQASMKHDLIVISDSDMRVGPDYLRRVVAPFADSRTGAATCLYRGLPTAKNTASILGAMAINETFLPSVLVARRLQRLRYCFGATMAVRRSDLEAIGGFRALASQLADDYMLGRLVSDRGREVVLAPYVVDADVDEPSLRELFLHELRWARTIRSMRPASYAGTILTMTLGWSIALALTLRFSAAGLVAIAAAVTLRLILALAVGRTLGSAVPIVPWLMPPRSILSGIIFMAAHFGRSVRWRSAELTVAPGGALSMKKS